MPTICPRCWSRMVFDTDSACWSGPLNVDSRRCSVTLIRLDGFWYGISRVFDDICSTTNKEITASRIRTRTVFQTPRQLPVASIRNKLPHCKTCQWSFHTISSSFVQNRLSLMSKVKRSESQSRTKTVRWYKLHDLSSLQCILYIVCLFVYYTSCLH